MKPVNGDVQGRGATGDAVRVVTAVRGAFSGVAGVALVLLLAAGCANIPQKELTAYTTAVTAARTAGEQMTHDWEAARAELERREAARKSAPPAPAPPPIPLTWAPPENSAAKLSAEKVRLLAWETVGEYTAILAALNAGESVETVKSSAGRLFDVVEKVAKAAGGSIPGGEALVTLFVELAELLEEARLTEEFKKAIRGGAPKVRAMLAVFRQDTIDHARLRASLAAADYERVDLEPGLTANEKRAKKARIKAANDEFRQSLDNYVRLLDQTDHSLAALQTAVDQPIDFVAQSNRILDIAIDLKQHWVAYQNARAEAKF